MQTVEKVVEKLTYNWKLYPLCAGAQGNYPVSIMCSRVMCLVTSVFTCDQKIDLISALPFKKSCWVYYTTCSWNLICLKSNFLRPASCTDGAIYAYSIKVSPGILYYNMPHPIILYIMQHAAPQWQAATAGFVKIRSENYFNGIVVSVIQLFTNPNTVWNKGVQITEDGL